VESLRPTGGATPDTLNQAFRYTSLRRSSKNPDRKHPFGYGKERFFWALIAAVGIFVAGVGFSLYEATEAFAEAPTQDRNPCVLNYVWTGRTGVASHVFRCRPSVPGFQVKPIR
jgi:divalent metal cation (Fe/Co/Zn/Cd) transporter